MRFVVVPWSWRIEPRTILVVGPTFEVEGGAKVRPRHPVHQIERKKKQQEQELEGGTVKGGAESLARRVLTRYLAACDIGREGGDDFH
jgi:hypothetical protein